MKYSFAFSLCLATSTSLFSNPLTYPENGKWNFTAGAQSGIESTHLRFLQQVIPGTTNRDNTGDVYGTGPLLNLNQSFGYGKWFYIQTRQSVTVLTTGMVPSDREDGNEARLKGAYFFDTDARAFFPFRLSRKNRITLGPLLGYSVRLSHFKQQSTREGVEFTPLKTRSFAPILGIALGLEPTPRFALRPVLAAEIPTLSNRVTPAVNQGPLGPISGWEALRMHRLAWSASIDMFFTLTPYLSLEGSIDYYVHSLIDSEYYAFEGSPYFDINYASRLKAKLGVQWRF